MDHEGPAHPGLAATDVMDVDQDAELAAAIHASYRSQTFSGNEETEDAMLAMALEQSRLEEEERQRRSAGGDDVARGEDAMPEGLSPLAPDGRSPVAGVGDAAGTVEDPADESVSYVDHEANDAHLAAALEASYAAQTSAGMQASEDDLLMQAIQISQREEESRQRAALREQQEQELQESMLMDQMRELEEQRQRDEERQQASLEAQRLEEEAKQREAEKARVCADLAAKQARVPPEPAADAPDRVVVAFRLPGGQRLRRAFCSSNSVGQVYDYLDLECQESLTGVTYRLVSTMPRREYNDRSQALADADLSGQCALLIELL